MPGFVGIGEACFYESQRPVCRARAMMPQVVSEPVAALGSIPSRKGCKGAMPTMVSSIMLVPVVSTPVTMAAVRILVELV